VKAIVIAWYSLLYNSSRIAISTTRLQSASEIVRRYDRGKQFRHAQSLRLTAMYYIIVSSLPTWIRDGIHMYVTMKDPGVVLLGLN
jgi:hypothetical protein